MTDSASGLWAPLLTLSIFGRCTATDMDKIREADPTWLDRVRARRVTIAKDEDLAWSFEKLRAMARSVRGPYFGRSSTPST